MPRTSTKLSATAGRHEAAYRLDDQVGFLLRRAYQRASANLVDRIGIHDLTAPQFATLARLHERGKVSQNLLGRLVAMEPANIRDVVQRLKKRRLVTTERDPTDGRLILVSLSSTGQSLIRDLLPVEIDCTAKTLAPLERDERKLLYDLLRRLAEG
jgi:MarR family transcriptional regulator, lower aerobic nicotinate degradation pathway regulator